MEKGVDLTEIVDQNNNLIDFSAEKAKRTAPATGGIGGDDNWLNALEIGSVFTARQKVQKGQMRPWLCTLYFLRERGEHCACVKGSMPDGNNVVLWVHTLDFSRQNDYVETLAILDIDPVQEKIEREIKIDE